MERSVDVLRCWHFSPADLSFLLLFQPWQSQMTNDVWHALIVCEIVFFSRGAAIANQQHPRAFCIIYISLLSYCTIPINDLAYGYTQVSVECFIIKTCHDWICKSKILCHVEVHMFLNKTLQGVLVILSIRLVNQLFLCAIECHTKYY